MIDEVSAGDPREVEKRIAAIANTSALEVMEDAETLAQAILASGVLPASAIRDAAHVAVATFHALDYLLTWNCKHLANAQILRKIESVCTRLGYRMLVICTPQRIDGSVIMWEDPIVAEVHRIREKLASEFNFDVKAIFADIRKRQTALGSRLVSQTTFAEPTGAFDRERPTN